MIAAIYARKSTDDSDRTEEARSTTRQVERATAYAQAKGWTVDPRYIFVDDAVSGAEWKHRPGFNALLAALTPRPPFDVLVVSELSRIGRDTVRTPAAILQLEEAGVEIRAYLSDAPITLADESGEIMTVVQSLAASFERRRARQRTHDALRRMAEAGYVTGGVVFGYDNVPILMATGKRDHVERRINDAEAAVVRRIFTLYAGGKGLTRVAKTLNAERVPPPRGHDRGWAPTAIREILRRELYRGIVLWNRTAKVMRGGTKDQQKRPPAEWLRREAPGLRIIDEALWTAVEARRQRAATTFARTTRTGRLVSRPSGADLESPYLLSGLAQCGPCGGSLVAVTRSHGRHRAKFYACVYHHKRGATVCANAVELRQACLDEAVVEALASALSPRAIEVAVAKALAKLRVTWTRDRDRRAALDRERAAIETRIAHLGDAIKRGKATDTLLDLLAIEEDHRKALARELTDLADLEQTAALDAATVAREVATIAEETRPLLYGYPAQVRQMIRKLLEDGRLHCEPIEVDGRVGYRFQATGTYARLFTGTVLNDVRSPSGTPRRARVLPLAFRAMVPAPVV